MATPTFNPPAGSYGSTQPVTISTTTSGASIRYTTDGSTPSETVGTVYGGPVSVSSNLTLKAIAYESGMTDSQVASAAYTIAVATPTFNPPAGSYGSTQPVTISTTTSGASIRYTTDGSTPSETVGTVYRRTGFSEQQPDAEGHRLQGRHGRQHRGFGESTLSRPAGRTGTTPPGRTAS